MKCPYCNSDNLKPIEHDNPNTRYVITTANIATKEFNPANGVPIILYGCTDCKSIHIKCELI